MASPREFAALFARTLDLFRDPGAKEEQKAQFRTLTGLLKVQGVTLSVQDGRLAVNGTTLDGNTLAQRLEFHAVKEITIPADPPVAEVFELLRALADQPGDEDIASRLRANGTKRISVTMHTPVLEPESPAEPRAPARTDTVLTLLGARPRAPVAPPPPPPPPPRPPAPPPPLRAVTRGRPDHRRAG